MLREADRPACSGKASRPDAISTGAVGGKRATIAAILTAAVLAIPATIGSADATPRGKPNQIKYEYVLPKDPAHQPIRNQIKEGRVLEHLQQLLSPLRLSYPLTLKVAG